MTDKQIEQAKNRLPGYKNRTDAQRREFEELACREMINCCFVYGEERYNFYDPATGKFGKYAQDYVNSLGAATVIRLYEEQQADFAKAIVKRGVYTDCEGCSYNSIIWADEQPQHNPQTIKIIEISIHNRKFRLFELEIRGKTETVAEERLNQYIEECIEEGLYHEVRDIDELYNYYVPQEIADTLDENEIRNSVEHAMDIDN